MKNVKRRRLAGRSEPDRPCARIITGRLTRTGEQPTRRRRAKPPEALIAVGTEGVFDLSEFWKLEEVDADGAIQEMGERIVPDTRAAFLRKAGIGAGALIGGGALMGALPSMASAATARSTADADILNYALTLEYLEAAFYNEAVAKGALKGETARFAKVVASHENAHVAFLKSALGTKAVKKPKFDFKGTTGTQSTFQATAEVLEYTGVAAYLGQVGNIKSKAILGAAGSILPIEAYHAAWIADIRRHGVKPYPAPVAFAKGKTKAQILAAVTATGFIVG